MSRIVEKERFDAQKVHYVLVRVARGTGVGTTSCRATRNVGE